MTYVNPLAINPITAAVLPAALAQGRLAAGETRGRRQQRLARAGVADARDRFEHVVDGAEAVPPVRDEEPRDDRRPSKGKRAGAGADDDAESGDGEPPHIDVTG